MIEFFLPSKVAVKGNSKRIVKFGSRLALIGDEKARRAEETLVARLMEFRPAEPFAGPVRLTVTFVMGIAASWPRWKQQAALEGRLWPTSRPDRGNALKLIEDAMNGLFFVDDSQVVDGPVTKVYGQIPGYRIRLEELPQATKESEAARAKAAPTPTPS